MHRPDKAERSRCRHDLFRIRLRGIELRDVLFCDLALRWIGCKDRRSV
jgi:hypothetical protein